MSDLVEKLLARLSKIEVDAQAAYDEIAQAQQDPDRHGIQYGLLPKWWEHVNNHPPSAVLRRCARDREIVEHFRNLVAKYKHLKSLDYLTTEQVAELRTVQSLIADFTVITLPALARGYGLEVEPRGNQQS